MYELKIYYDSGNTGPHYVKVDEEDLTNFRKDINDDTNPDFIEVWCHDSNEVFAISRKKVNAYSYKEVNE